MILDTLENLPHYYSLHKYFEKAYTFLSQDNLETLPPGKYDIVKDELFAIIVNEEGRCRDDAELEAHLKYIDIQYVLSGIDEMGWKALSASLKESMAYDESKDLIFYQDKPDSYFEVSAGSYAIFFPTDTHKPFLNTSAPGQKIHKVILKIAV